LLRRFGHAIADKSVPSLPVRPLSNFDPLDKEGAGRGIPSPPEHLERELLAAFLPKLKDVLVALRIDHRGLLDGHPAHAAAYSHRRERRLIDS